MDIRARVSVGRRVKIYCRTSPATTTTVLVHFDMKRSALAEPSSPLAVSAQPKAKKLKVSRSPHSSASVSASVAVTVSVPTATPKSSTADTEDGDGWTKVEKRRAKKMRKADAKMSVRCDVLKLAFC